MPRGWWCLGIEPLCIRIQHADTSFNFLPYFTLGEKSTVCTCLSDSSFLWNLYAPKSKPSLHLFSQVQIFIDLKKESKVFQHKHNMATLRRLLKKKKTSTPQSKNEPPTKRRNRKTIYVSMCNYYAPPS